MSKRRIVITGMGIISPTGNTVSESWDNVSSGISGITPLIAFNTETFSSKIAGSIKNLDLGKYLDPKEARRSDPFIHYGIASAKDAIADAKLPAHLPNTGVMMGAGIGGLYTIENNYEKFLTSGARKISPYFVPGSIVNMISGHISIEYGYTGPNLSLVSACATASHCIGLSARLIQAGDADVMIAGGSEHATTPLGVGGFCAARALSTRNDDPTRASRPWDKDRDGFVLSDGAACLVLEELEHAQKRNAHIYAELVGFGMSGDANHITSPCDDGRGAKACMEKAISDAGIAHEDIDYINAHGTSTPLGDMAETTAIKATFGKHAYKLAVSSTKSTTGHMLGAAGGAEAIFSILALNNNLIPPTANLETPSEGCDLDYTPINAKERELNYVLSNSFGFGGTNGSLIFTNYRN
jgi:3-oxoacyl-[acyl-carrier-protein] synthase II